MAEAEFCDLYPRFLETTETVPSRSRLNARWRAIIGWNEAIFAGRRIVDLGCHDGRWGFAALMAGAAHLVGIEARAHLANKASENLGHYGIPASRYDIVTGDAIETLKPEEGQKTVAEFERLGAKLTTTQKALNDLGR